MIPSRITIFFTLIHRVPLKLPNRKNKRMLIMFYVI